MIRPENHPQRTQFIYGTKSISEHEILGKISNISFYKNHNN